MSRRDRRRKAIVARVDGRDRLIIHEKAMFACRPIVWPFDAPESPIYPGSVKGLCCACQTGIWIGPKAQEYGDQILPYCFACSLHEKPDLIANLGNTYLPEDTS